MSEKPLDQRFLENVHTLGVGREPARFVVALSGGLDSTVLLHLARSHLPEGSSVVAAHFDHRMRQASEEDALWVADLCASWEVPLHTGVAETQLRTEAEARQHRYRFLFGVLDSVDARWLATAHHADDQAETVLFRILRGTGLAGLRGIPARTRRGVIRPLLPFWRKELEDYALQHGLAWRDDPTNQGVGPARNRIRHRLLPEIEREIAPGARRNLVALAELAAEAESALGRDVNAAWSHSVRREGEAFVLVRKALAAYHPAVSSRVLRRVLRSLGGGLGRPGTRSLLQFITDAPSGREMQLPGGLRVLLEFGAARIEAPVGDRAPEQHVLVPLPRVGHPFVAHLCLAGHGYRVVAREGSGDGQDADRDAVWRARLSLPASRFPLLLRSRQPGDRVRTTGGTKSLKKLMIEGRVPRHQRERLPVLVDAEETVLWVAGFAPAAGPPVPGDIELNLAVYDD